jgi:hypothetical protein
MKPFGKSYCPVILLCYRPNVVDSFRDRSVWSWWRSLSLFELIKAFVHLMVLCLCTQNGDILLV